MFKPRKTILIAALALATVLTACSTQDAPPKAQKPVPDGFVTLTLALDAASLNSQALEAQGVPYEPRENANAVDEVQVSVTDKDNNAVKFDFDAGTDTYTASTNGTETHITLSSTSGAAGVKVLLPAPGDPYAFTSRGYQTGSSSVIAYDSRSQNVRSNPNVMVMLTSVIGEARLEPRFPTHIVTPGQPLDLMLIVMANGNTGFPGDYLQVPLNDFEVAYGVLEGDITLDATSKRGVRLGIPASCTTPVGISGTVTGLEESAGSFAEGQFEISGPTGGLACPPAMGSGVKADIVAPEVTLAFDPMTGAATITAYDDFGIAKVQLFDGPQLIASTDETELGKGGVEEITYSYGRNEFITAIATPTTGFLTAVATDPSGNEGRSAEVQNRLFLYVATFGNDATGNGTAAQPYATIAKAMGAVLPNGTVYVLDGSYQHPTSSAIGISKAGVTLRGQSQDGVIIKADVALNGSFPGYGIEVTGDNVTLESFTLISPNASSQGRGIHARGNPVQTDLLEGLTIRNVTVTGAKNIGVSINTTTGTVLEGVTVIGRGAGNPDGGEGIGINLKNSSNAMLRDVHTQRNAIGVSIETIKVGQNYLNNDPANITFEGSASTDDLVGLMTEIYDGHAISNIDLGAALTYGYAVSNPKLLKALDSSCTGDGTPYAYYVADLAAAEGLKAEFCDPAMSTVRAVSTTDASELQAFTVPVGWSIQAAVDAAAEHDTISLLAGTHETPGITVNTAQLRILGAGAGNTTVNGPIAGGDNTSQTPGFRVNAANVEISGLQLINYYTGVKLHEAPNAYLHDLEFSASGMALLTPTVHRVDGLRFEDSQIHDTTSGVLIQHGKTNPTPARNATFDGLTLTDVADKGFYLEAFTDSTIRNVEMTRVGNGPKGPTQGSVGLEVNLKYGNHGTVTLSNITITDSGWSNADGSFGGSTLPTNINAAALAVAVRDDGSYGSSPAALSNLVLENITITGAYNAIRLGESKDLSQPTVGFTTGATSTVLAGLNVTATNLAIANYNLNDVDATDTDNTINGKSVGSENFAIEAALLHGTSDARLGVIRLAPDSLYAIASRSITTAINAADAGDTIHVSPETHTVSAELTLDKRLTLRGAGATSVLDVTSPTGISVRSDGAGSSIENLKINLLTSNAYAVELRKPSPRNVRLADVTIVGLSGAAGGGTGVKVESGADASDFTMTGGSISNVFTGLYVPGSSGTLFTDVTLDGVTIHNAADKAIYVEALSNAEFKNLTITDSGNVGNSSGKNGAGISINITHGPAGNITISNSSVTNSGGSPNGGGAAVTLKSADGVTFQGITIDYSTLTNSASGGAGVALRIGEPTPSANNLGPTNVAVSDSSLTGSQYAVYNHAPDPVTLTGGSQVGAVVYSTP